nr:hypothetical protein BaRGS_012528 [Batillaria attramentaria]
MCLFEKNEEVMMFFKGLDKTKTVTELRTCKVLENHARGVMLTIDEAITNLDDADTVIETLNYVGKTHTRFEAFNPNVFWLLQEPFLLAVKDTLGDRYSAHMQDIYQRAIAFILRTLIDGFTQQQHKQPLAITDLGEA